MVALPWSLYSCTKMAACFHIYDFLHKYLTILNTISYRRFEDVAIQPVIVHIWKISLIRTWIRKAGVGWLRRKDEGIWIRSWPPQTPGATVVRMGARKGVLSCCFEPWAKFTRSTPGVWPHAVRRGFTHIRELAHRSAWSPSCQLVGARYPFVHAHTHGLVSHKAMAEKAIGSHQARNLADVLLKRSEFLVASMQWRMICDEKELTNVSPV